MAETTESFATKGDIEALRADLTRWERDYDKRLTNVEVGQKWIIWIVGIILAMVVGNFAVTIAMAIHMLTQR